MVIYVVTDPPYGAGPGKIPAQGSATAHQKAAKAEGGGETGISSAGVSNGRSGF